MLEQNLQENLQVSQVIEDKADEQMLFNQNEILKYHQTKNDIKNKQGKKLPMMSDFLKNMEKKNTVAKG